MAVDREDLQASRSALLMAREVADYAQRLVKASGSETPMLDFLSVIGTAHAYVLQFAILEGSDKEATLAMADKLVRRMVDVFARRFDA